MKKPRKPRTKPKTGRTAPRCGKMMRGGMSRYNPICTPCRIMMTRKERRIQIMVRRMSTISFVKRSATNMKMSRKEPMEASAHHNMRAASSDSVMPMPRSSMT